MKPVYKGYAVVAIAKATRRWPTDDKGRPMFVPGTLIEVRFGFFKGYTPASKEKALAAYHMTRKRVQASPLFRKALLLKVKHLPNMKTIYKAVSTDRLFKKS